MSLGLKRRIQDHFDHIIRSCDHDHMIWYNSHPCRRVVAFLDKSFFPVNLLLVRSHHAEIRLVAANKQQINWEKVKESTGKRGNWQLLSE